MKNRMFSVLEQYGFKPVNDNICVGTWKNYAVELQRFNQRNYYVYLAIRIPKESGLLKKSLNDAIKSAGIKKAGVLRAAPNFINCTFIFGREENDITSFFSFLDALTSALMSSGVGPANTCALTGASDPDSLCLVGDQKYLGYQPVSSAAARQNDYRLQSRVDDNEANGSHISGFFGALIGMLLAVAVNVLVMKYFDLMASLLFALVPIAAMCGYKLFKGKTDKASMMIIILLSLLAVPLMVYLIVAVTLIQEYALSLGTALRVAVTVALDVDFLTESSGDILRMAAFMGLGLFVAWRFLTGQLNSSRAEASRLQMETLLPNPACSRGGAVPENPVMERE